MGFGMMSGKEAVEKMVALHEAYSKLSPQPGGAMGGKEMFIAIMYAGFLSEGFHLDDEQVMDAINIGRKTHHVLAESGNMTQIEVDKNGNRVTKDKSPEVEIISDEEAERMGEDFR